MKRVVLVAVGWLATAGAAAAGATVALNTIGAGLLGSGSRPLTQSDVRRDLGAGGNATGTSPGSTPSPSDVPVPTAEPSRSSPPPPKSGPVTAQPTGTGTTTPPPQPDAVTRVLATRGGTIVARCASGLVTLQSWSPAQGYSADHVVRGPATVASIRFDPGSGRAVRVTVTCHDGVPEATTGGDD